MTFLKKVSSNDDVFLKIIFEKLYVEFLAIVTLF